MSMSKIWATTFCLAGVVVGAGSLWAQTLVSTGFETDEGYVVGNIMNQPSPMNDLGWALPWEKTGGGGGDQPRVVAPPQIPLPDYLWKTDPLGTPNPKDVAPQGSQIAQIHNNSDTTVRRFMTPITQNVSVRWAMRLDTLGRVGGRFFPSQVRIIGGHDGVGNVFDIKIEVNDFIRGSADVNLETFSLHKVYAGWFGMAVNVDWADQSVTYFVDDKLDGNWRVLGRAPEIVGEMDADVLKDGFRMPWDQGTPTQLDYLLLRSKGNTVEEGAVWDDVIVAEPIEIPPPDECASAIDPIDIVAVATEGQAAVPSQVVYTINNNGSVSHTYTVEEVVMAAPTIPDLYSTGVDDANAVLGEQVLDPHWTLIEGGLEGICTEAAPCSTYTMPQDGFPIPSPWMANNAASMWITASQTDGNGNAPSGNHVFRTTFTLADQAAADAATIYGRVMMDNRLLEVRLNGAGTQPSVGVDFADAFTHWNTFAITSGFVVGTNTLDFVVNNYVGAANPMGFRTEFFNVVPGNITWLSTDYTSPIAIPSLGSDTVTATISTAGLSPGVRGGLLRFASDCADPGPEVFLREIDLTVSNWDVSPAENAQRVTVGLQGDCDGASIEPAQYTVSNVGLTAVNYTVEKLGDCDWLQLDRNGGTVTAGNSETVTATIDATGLPIGNHYCTLLFSNVGSGLPARARTVTLTVLGTVWKYFGDVDPTSADSAGDGLSFRIDEGVNQGFVEDVPSAVAGKVWHIQDTDQLKTKFRTQPDYAVSGLLGATVVARVKVLNWSGTRTAGLFIWDFEDGLTCEYHFGGPDGQVRESRRGPFADIEGSDEFHIWRMTAEGTSNLDRTINLYLDENPTPVISIPNAAAVSPGGTILADGLGFGAGSTGGTYDIVFDWVTATNAGAFPPGQESACLGETLVLKPCNLPFADADGDGDVDMADFAEFQRCITGPDDPADAFDEERCQCFDRDGQRDVDERDLNAFLACATGPAVVFDPQNPPLGCSP